MNNKERLYHIVFETDSKAGKRFDVVLLWLILVSVLVVMLESVPEYGKKYYAYFHLVEWIFTGLFTLEYIIRLIISPKPLKYVTSFWGIIDLLSVLPTWAGLFKIGYHYLLVVRIFRLLRVFRILKLARFNKESQVLFSALKASIHKVSIFMLAVVAIVTLMGTIMYVVEGGEKGFTSIPQSIYWAIVTVTTVGYGDMVPHTVLGKFISSIAMIIGYAIIAVPTGIVTVEMTKKTMEGITCEKCGGKNNLTSNFCTHCGNVLNNPL